MAEVFLSHTSSDAAAAAAAKRWLEADGHHVFIDSDIAPGAAWRPQLYRQLQRADVIVCLVSQAYIDSEWCFAEIVIAESLGCLVIPLRLSPGITHGLLKDNQHTDADPESAREQVLGRLQDLDSGGQQRWTSGKNPYPGLAPFTTEQSLLYFGRSQERRELAALLRPGVAQGVIAIAGPSGCGKSSVLRAGAIPAMVTDEDWLIVEPWSPGNDPLYALATAVAATARRHGLAWPIDEIRDRLTKEIGLRTLLDDIRTQIKGRRPENILLPLDQAEDLFGPGANEDSCRLSADALATLSEQHASIICSVRTEYLDDLQSWFARIGRPVRPYLLGRIASGMLRSVIVEPARIAGLRIDSELVDQLVSDTESGEALPYLAFTLQRLADGLGRGDALTMQTYDDLGSRLGYDGLRGVHAILVGRADLALKVACEQSASSQPELLDMLTQLVDIDSAGRWVRRTVNLDEVPLEMRKAMEIFVANRLLTQDESGRNVRLIHDALLTSWPALTKAIENRSDVLRVLRAVEQGAAEWVEDGSEQVAGLSPTAVRFLRASRVKAALARRRQRFRRARALIALSILLIAAMVAGVVAAVQGGQARDERDAATARGLIARADAERRSNPELALQLDLAANAIDPTLEAAAGLTRSLTANTYASTLVGHNGSVFSVAFRPDGGVLASGAGDNSVRLWDVHDIRHPMPLGIPLSGHSDLVQAVAFSPNGQLLATESNKETILWDVTKPADPVKLQTLTTTVAAYPDVMTISFNPQGTALATTFGGQVKVWQVSPGQSQPLSNPTLIAQFAGDGNVLASFSGDGSRLAYAGPATQGDGTAIQLWSANGYEYSGALPNVAGTVTSIAFNPLKPVLAVAATLATTASDAGTLGRVTLWDTSYSGLSSRIGEPFDTQADDVRGLAFSVDGNTLATGSNDHTVILWNVKNPNDPQALDNPLADHTNSVYTVAFARDGTLATGSSDNTIRLWGAGSVVQPIRTDGGTLDFPATNGHDSAGLASLTFSPDSRMLATVSSSGVTAVWDIVDPTAPVGPISLPESVGRVSALTFAPQGHLLAVGQGFGSTGGSRKVSLWDLTDLEDPTQRGPDLTGHVNNVVALHFSADGSSLWSADSSVRLIRWDTSDLANPTQTADALQGRAASTSSIVFRQDGRAIASPDILPEDEQRQFAVIRDISDPDHVMRLLNPMGDNDTSVVAFDPSGRLLATGGNDVLLWDVSTAWQPRRDGRPLGIKYCKASNTDNTGCVTALAISADGRTLAVGGTDGVTTVWDISDPTQPLEIGGQLARAGSNDSIDGLAFSPDGRSLASIDDVGHVSVWNLGPLQDVRGNLVALACERARRGLSPDEWRRYVGINQSYQATCPS